MRRLAVLVGGVAAVSLVAVNPVQAHDHPSGISDLVTPAVVRVETVSHVRITLLDHIGEIRQVERSYDVPIGSGTGFVVSSDGEMVTLGRVVKSDQDVGVHAANRIFAEHHKVDIPADFAQHTVKNKQLNRQLQLCYSPEKTTATCIIDITTDITVFPNISPPDTQGFKAEVLHTGESDAPAVLRAVDRADGSAGLPTAPLADKVPDKEGSPVNVVGLLGRPVAGSGHHVDVAHLRKGGSGEGGRGFADPYKKVDEPPKLGALVDKGLLGAPVIGNDNGHVIGLLIGGGADARMIGVREITSALQKAKVVPRRGTIDAAFEAALTRFHTKYYTAAASGFQRVLDLYPGHVVAAEHLKTSLAKRGTAEDAGAKQVVAPSRGGPPLWPFIVAAAILLMGSLAGVLLLWRRRAVPPSPQESHAQSPLLPPPVAIPQATFDDRASPTVVVRRSQAFPIASQPVLAPEAATAKSTENGSLGGPSMKYCTACGMRLGNAHKFCGYCGHANVT